MKVAAVNRCVRILAETIASLPLQVYERMTDGGRRLAVNHPLYDVLHRRPNAYQTSYEFRELIQGALLLWGNAYAEILRDGQGRVKEVRPLITDRMKVAVDNGRVVYAYTKPDGQQVQVSSQRVLHLRDMSFTSGVMGTSRVNQCCDCIGLARATEEYGSRFFSNNARPGGILTTEKHLTPESKARLKEQWESAHASLSNAHRVAVLEDGLQWTQIGMTSQDAQFLETRRFQIKDIARIFGVPLHMLGDNEHNTYNNAEHQSMEFVAFTVRPWLVRWEQTLQESLLSESDRKRFFIEFNVDGLLRGDAKSRFESYALGRQHGWLSVNDVRRLENMDPVSGGDNYLQPVNMAPVNGQEGAAGA
ncbi:MAG: phage portal protein [Proteobacteria bacterium]|nr:phage portal protein [Pseudomonadota bacterium]